MLRRKFSIILSIVLCSFTSVSWSDIPAVGDSSVFLSKYTTFRAQQLRRADSQIVTIRLGFVKGLSRSFTGIAGTLALNLQTGEYRAAFNGLRPGDVYSVWLVDQRDDAPVSDMRDARLVKLVDIKYDGISAQAEGVLDSANLSGFAIDRVVLARGIATIDEAVASGSMNVMEKIFFSGGVSPVIGLSSPSLPLSFLVPTVLTDLTTTDPVLTVDSLSSTSTLTSTTTTAVSTTSTPLDVLIAQGENLFFNNTFGGNGRTCGTCHPAAHNFTIDTDFISTLPPTDPLFVAEFNPALAQLERPTLMRQFGLILENLDGLDDPTNKFVMRSVPHTLGLQSSLITDTNQVNPPAAMTGWSGDGAPGAGALRDFAVGAVTQHFTKSLARVPGQDFTLPNNHQLDAMEAFQLSLGRAADFDLTKITFLDANVAAGQAIFVNGTGDPLAGGRCSACHGSAGALAGNGQNRNFNTNVEDVPHPARAIENFPHDGGFGQTPNPDGTFGNRSFNTAPVVEAADTAPFFHNNVVSTLEGVVAFYAGPEFNTPRAPGGRFSFTPAQATDLANFMRAINTLQNINVAQRELAEILALNGSDQPQVQSRLLSAFADSGDAIRVLTEGNIFPGVVTQVTAAQQLIAQAQQTSNPNTRATIIAQAISVLDNARNALASITP